MNEKERPTILVVDDTPSNLALITKLLTDQYRVRVANNGERALELAVVSPPDLILLDVMMPDMDGYEVCRRLKGDSRTERVPVIFLSAQNSVEDEEQGLLLGAVDFIHKPISPPIVMARIKTHLQVKSWNDFLLDKNTWLQMEVERRLSEINSLQEASFLVMVTLAEFRDQCTGNHIRRSQEYARVLAEQLSRNPKYAVMLTPENIERIAKSAPLHDIGKIAIPDTILLKPGRFTPEEFAVMKTHSERGCNLLKAAGEHLGEQSGIHTAMEIARWHHEKWDGSGYPDGLAGDQIPLSARIMAVVDVFDALMTARPYKVALSRDQAYSIINKWSGTHFDPELVEAFMAIPDDIRRIAET